MKTLSTILVLWLFVIQGHGQNTWIQKLNFKDWSPYLHSDSLTGIRDIAIGADGYIYVLAFIDQNGDEYLFKVSSSGSIISWSIMAGYHSGMSGMYSRNVWATTDSGCVISSNYWDNSQLFENYGTVQKYSKGGDLDWSYQFIPHTNNAPYYDKKIYHVMQNMAGNYYALVGDGVNDSLYEFDPGGNIILATDTIGGINLYEMSNGDVLLQKFDSTLNRMSLTGNILWSIPCYRVLDFSPAFAFIISPSGIQKVNTSNGSIIWTKTFPFGISSVKSTPDGGFVGASGYIPSGATDFPRLWGIGNQLPATLCRVDSMGDTLWTKEYDFPHFGFSCINQLPTGNIITGGTFIFTNKDHLMFARDYSAFLTSLDSLGNGPLQKTSLTWPGNANDNSICGFVDDVLYTSIALGYTGPSRDTLDTLYNTYRKGLMSDYAIDWVDTFSNGVNFKHADFNGDGVVDSTDIALYSQGYFGLIQPITIQSWRFTNPDIYYSTLPDFRFIPERDTVAPGDTMKFFIFAGGNVAVDSIYGLAFASAYDPYLVIDSPIVYFNSSGLGTLGSDLLTYQFLSMFKVNGMACRIDHQNIFNLNDTVGMIMLPASDTISSTAVFTLQATEFNALTFGQQYIPFNLVGGTVVIEPGYLDISENNNLRLKVYPIPASERLTISGFSLSDPPINISIFNLIGKKIMTLKSTGSLAYIPTNDLPDGYYTGYVTSENSFSTFSFIIRH